MTAYFLYSSGPKLIYFYFEEHLDNVPNVWNAADCVVWNKCILVWAKQKVETRNFFFKKASPVWVFFLGENGKVTLAWKKRVWVTRAPILTRKQPFYWTVNNSFRWQKYTLVWAIMSVEKSKKHCQLYQSKSLKW